MATVVCGAERAQWSHFWPPVTVPTCQFFVVNKTVEGIVWLPTPRIRLTVWGPDGPWTTGMKKCLHMLTI